MLVVQDLTINVDGNTILKQLTLEYGAGVHIIMGPNGVGKSTFAHALMGNPNYQVEGGATLNNKDLLDLETHERAQAGLFVSFQNPTPIEGLSNFQFVKQCLTAKNGPISIKDNLAKFRGLAEDLGLEPSWDRK